MKSNDPAVQHIAIRGSDTETSLRFHRGVRGLRVAGESENHGIEVGPAGGAHNFVRGKPFHNARNRSA